MKEELGGVYTFYTAKQLFQRSIGRISNRRHLLASVLKSSVSHYKSPNGMAANHRTEWPQITERNGHKSPNGMATNRRTVDFGAINLIKYSCYGEL